MKKALNEFGRTSKIDRSNKILALRSLQIGANIWQIRKNKGISQVELANKAQVTQKMISDIENWNDYNPWIDVIVKIVNALWVTESVLTSKIDWLTCELINIILQKAKSIEKIV